MLTKFVAVSVAAVSCVALWVAGLFGPGGDGVALGDVLRPLQTAEMLHLEIIRGDDASEIWIQQPGAVRREESPTRYEIMLGSRLWRVDEDENTAVSEDSPYFTGPGENVDLFSVIGLDVAANSLVGVRSTGTEPYDGVECDVFETTIEDDGRELALTWYAEHESNRLRSIVARPIDANRDVPPVFECRLLSIDEPVDEDLFVVADSLSEDGRIGKVLQAQGVVSLKPVMNARWTPLARQMLIRPGDWLRTDVRGANAALAAMTTEVQLTVGPASLVEFISPSEVRLHYGQVQINSSGKLEEPFLLRGPGEAQVEVTAEGKQIIRVAQDESLATLAEPPIWLQGFEGTTSNESIGSLIVNVEGSNVPLTVGYHHVSVEIRDQIVRTTIEQSFVNHTDSRLEGVFHFPLPQDASISGFGMWIGDELVEADVVEKQRAREIYETILREKRDPGLLEWTGGNIFKARVFPIEPNSEKRIKIVYTQVLPLRGNRYRYSYALNSELLRTSPLRELSIDVLCYSDLPLKNVECPSHDVRSELTAHSAHVEFSAQEYSPDQDFELVFELDERQSDVVVIPHRRGDDGYFLIQLMPPSAEGNWQREVLPDGEPLNLLILCDTSASMDLTKREQQREFVASLLSSLSEQDHFRLAACDVETVWCIETATRATEDARMQVANFLDARTSLGWTDLDRAFEAVKEAAANDPGTVAGGSPLQVIYVGDGIVSAGDTDPAGFAQRVTLLFGDDTPVTFHSVSVGSSYESVALKGIAAIGSGSIRAIGGDMTPAVVAFELLNEIAQPGLKDIEITFRGLQTAAVYPDTLPNVAAGTQQIIVGRYLPEGVDQRGEVVVTGTLNGEPVRYAAQVNLPNEEAGNSFIPRLWARAHLDFLMAQGTSQFIRDQIISLSEEFHIITPYTSLLVLESDADRERFGVIRRYEMRDGEQFFAEGRNEARYELLQQQMRRAGDWRIELRRQILAQLATLGRSPDVFQQYQPYYDYYEVNGRLGGLGGGGRSMDSLAALSTRPMSGPAPGGMPFDSPLADFGRYEALNEWGLPMSETAAASRESDGSLINGPMASTSVFRDETESRMDRQQQLGDGLEDKFAPDFDGEMLSDFRSSAESLIAGEPMNQMGFGFSEENLRRRSFAGRGVSLWDGEMAQSYGGGFGGGYYYGQPDYFGWIDQIFPGLAFPAQPATDEPRSADWPADVRAITDLLYHVPALHAMEGGVLLRSIVDSRDPVWDRDTGHSESIELYSPTAWLSRPDGVGPARIINWCDAEQRGVYSATLGLGRVRESVETDWLNKRIGAGGFGDSPLHEMFHYMTAELISNENGQAVIVFTYKSDPTQAIRYTIDTEKNVVIKTEGLTDGEVTSTTTYENYVEVAGIWWPTTIVSLNADGEETSTTTQEITALTADEFAGRMNVEFSGTSEPMAEADGRTNVIAKSDVLFIELPLPDVEAAKLAVADGSADWNDHLTVMLHFMQTQQWDEVRQRLTSIETLEAGKPGLVWLQTALWPYTRSNADVLTLLTEQAELLVAQPRVDEWALVEHIRSLAYPITSWPEFGVLLELSKPIYDRQPEYIGAKWTYDTNWLSVLQNRGQTEEALELELQLAEQAPWDLYRQTTYANSLANSGRHEEAYAWLDALLEREQPFESYELQNVYNTYSNLMSGQGHYDRLVLVIERWIEQQPTEAGYDPYQRLLGTLIIDDQIDRAHELVREWVLAGRVEGEIPTEIQVKLDAAIYFMLGQAYHLNWYRVDARWLPLLKETAEFHLSRPDSFHVANTIMSSGSFTDTDEYNAIQRLAFDTLLEEAATRDISQLQSMLSWVQSGYAGFEASQDEWRQLVDALRARWEAETDVNKKYTLSEMVAGIYASYFTDEHLPFLRLRLKVADDDHRSIYHTALFEALMTQKWSAEIEAELFSMLPDLSAPPKPLVWEVIAADDVARQESLVTQLLAQLHALHRVVDRMMEARVQAATETFEAEEHPEDLTGQQLAAKQEEILKAAREGVLMSLSNARSVWTTVDEARPEGAPMTIILATLSEWASMEAIYIQVLLGENLEQVAAHCFTILGDEPPLLAEPPEDADEPPQTLATPIEWTQEILDGVRRHRALMTLMNLGARRSSDPALADRVVAYLDAGIAHLQDDERLWKSLKYSFLVALDRPDELIAALNEWIAEEEFTAPWRLALGKLHAERGELEEAIRLYEAVEERDELGPSEYRMLSDWYHVVDRKEDYERTRIAALMVVDEWTLQQYVQNDVYAWQNATGPRGNYVEGDVLFALKALIEKTGSLGSYTWLVQQLYEVSGDFRVLEILPDSVLGRTPQQVYPYLESIRSTLEVVRKEATSDKMLETVARLRQGDLSNIDLRALDLIEAMIERRASEVLNQPGPHITAAVAAMQRAFDRNWGEGERRQMADFLYNMGHISQPQLNEERLRELRELAAASDVTTDDGFWIAYRMSSVLCDYENRMDEGLARFATAIETYATANPEGWPSHMNEPLGRYLSLLQGQSRFSTAETLITTFLENPLNDGQRYWLREQLDELYLSALANDGQVSIGSGPTLYANLRDRVIGELETPDHNHRANLIYRLMRVYQTADEKRMRTADADLEMFAFEMLSAVLERQSVSYASLIQNVGQSLHDRIGARIALKFLVIRMQEYPERYEFTWESAWSQHSYSLALWTHEVTDANLGDIEPGLLEIVLKELRRDLLSREQRSREMYSVNYHYSNYWGKPVAEYRRVAEEVYQERRHSGRSVKYIADYMYGGIPDHGRAIEMLFTALDEGILDESGQGTLVSWLFENNRHAEAIPILQALMEKHPERIDYRTQLMIAYHHAGRRQQLRELLAATDEYFREPGRWNETNAAALANACVQCQLDEEAIEYFDFAIEEHQNTQPNRGIGGGTLSYYYIELARAHSRLGHTIEAVDAASSAIVSWGADDDNRQNAINRLNEVLAAAQDLDAYVAHWESEVAEKGQDSAVIRKALGVTYQARGNFAEAARHFELALEFGSFDADLYDQLLACYDALMQSEQAIDLLLKRLDFERHNFSLYSQLATRLAGDPAAVERAYTSIVEASPNEAENHQALAAIREGQGEWDEAVEHWEQVAELRSLEPHGLYGLIHAQIQAGQLTDARESLETLDETEWNQRFEDEVENKLAELRRELEMAMQ